MKSGPLTRTSPLLQLAATVVTLLLQLQPYRCPPQTLRYLIVGVPHPCSRLNARLGPFRIPTPPPRSEIGLLTPPAAKTNDQNHDAPNSNRAPLNWGLQKTGSTIKITLFYFSVTCAIRIDRAVAQSSIHLYGRSLIRTMFPNFSKR